MWLFYNLSSHLLLLQEDRPLYLRLENLQKSSQLLRLLNKKKVNNQKVLSEAHKHFENYLHGLLLVSVALIYFGKVADFVANEL